MDIHDRFQANEQMIKLMANMVELLSGLELEPDETIRQEIQVCRQHLSVELHTLRQYGEGLSRLMAMESNITQQATKPLNWRGLLHDTFNRRKPK